MEGELAMAQFKSKYLADAMLSWYKGTAFPAAPANIYVALLTTAPTARDGTGAIEVTGGAYARQAIASTAWQAIATSGAGLTAIEQLLQTNAVTFPTATANWGTIVGVALYDALTVGNLLEYGDLSASQVVNSGNTFQIPAQNIIVQEK